MARRIIFSQPISGHADLVGKADFGRAPFVLMVEYLPPHQGMSGKTYRVKMQIQIRDDKTLALVKAHGLLDAVVFSDGAVKETDKAQAEQSEAMLADLSRWELVRFLGSMWRWSRAKAAQARAIEVTFARLLHVVEIDGSMDEVSFVAYQVRSGIDKLAAKIATAESFEGGGEVRVYVPGEKPKLVKDKTGTPPSSWGH